MEYFVHDIEGRKTILVKLEDTFESIYKNFVDGYKTVGATRQVAHVHPKDNYNHKVGRKVAKAAPELTTFYIVKYINASLDCIRITLHSDDCVDLCLTKFVDTGKVIITNI